MTSRGVLSRLTGQPALTTGRAVIGRVVDLTVLLGATHPEVHRVAIGSGRRIRYLVPWPLVRSLDEREVVLDSDEASLTRYAVDGEPELEDGEVLLCRDVMDTQVVDLGGRRLSRVSDVLVARHPDGDIEIAAVDIGLGSLICRMGLRRLAARIAPVAVDWADLHLVSSRGHMVQLRTTTTGMHRLDAQGLADLLARLSTEQAKDVIRTVGPSRSAAALQVSHRLLRQRLLGALEPDEAEQVISAASSEAAEELSAAHEERQAPRRRYRRTAGWRVHRPSSAERSDGGAGR
jgi:hypothetical protein